MIEEEYIRLIFGLKLKQIRNDKSLSLFGLAKITGLSKSYLNEIEKGKKYPKRDKIILLAEAFETTYDHLVSLKLDKNLAPIGEILQSRILKEIPLDIFGIKESDLIDIIAEAPIKVNAFISTLFEIAKHYNLSKESFFLAALRSYQEAHNNYFESIENDVERFAKGYSIDLNKKLNLKDLEDILIEEYGYTINNEELTAHKELDEIIFELKNHIVGLNCGRWDYIFSFIKKLKNQTNFLVPDRDQVTMASPFMSAYSLKVIQTCHKRNILAIGGMAAQIPIKGDDIANALAFEKVKSDKEREVKNGHDGTWVAHPGLIPVAMTVFNEFMPAKNQMNVKRDDIQISEEQLLELPKGNVTSNGVRKNINVAILYIESWLMGTGAAALYDLMEDAATAEISRTQLWHWLNKKVVLEDGTICNEQLYEEYASKEILNIKQYVGLKRFEEGKFELATKLLLELILSEKLEEFLTLNAYQYLD